MSEIDPGVRAIEAVLFAAEAPLTPAEIAAYVGPDVDLKQALELLQEDYAGRGVELEDPREGLDDRRRRAGVPALFEPGVVVDAHAGEHRHLLAAQSADAASLRLRGDAGRLRSQIGPALTKEPAEV